ncbi:MAG: phosphoribosylamine--glycine ligase [Spirochaetaceae bacterium]|nr:phosphoribosylamine--glycine ligase [Spirochaetaceae bacterium]
MKVFIVGSGAREHAMAWAVARDLAHGSRRSARDGIVCLPGNAGTEQVARNLAIDPADTKAVLAACRDLKPDLVIVGPEGPLAAGLIDSLHENGIAAFGPPRNAATLESSKSSARSFSERYKIPCARTARFQDSSSLKRYLSENVGRRIVLKKSGLAAGKGVLESDSAAELLRFGEAVLESDVLLAEEFLVGSELSLFAVCDRAHRTMLPACADHKKAGAGEIGANTGGMGAVCPVPHADVATLARIEREIVDPTFRGMEAEGLTYRGVLFFGIMLTEDGPRLLEYNVRFGDPETQSLLPLFKSSFLELCDAAARDRLSSLVTAFTRDIACGVVVAAPGYPGSYPKGLAVDIVAGSDEQSLKTRGATSHLFHASTTLDLDGKIRTGGGRCFTAVGVGATWAEARAKAYERVSTVKFEGAWYRPDIGQKLYGP